MVPKVFTAIVCILICCQFRAGAVDATKGNSTQSALVECSVYPALPDGLTTFARGEHGTAQAGQTIILSNGYVAVEISASSGVIRSIENKLVNERHSLAGDETGISFTSQAGEKVEWFAREDVSREFEVQLQNDDAGCSA